MILTFSVSSLSAPIPIWHTGMLRIAPGAFILLANRTQKCRKTKHSDCFTAIKARIQLGLRRLFTGLRSCLESQMILMLYYFTPYCRRSIYRRHLVSPRTTSIDNRIGRVQAYFTLFWLLSVLQGRTGPRVFPRHLGIGSLRGPIPGSLSLVTYTHHALCSEFSIGSISLYTCKVYRDWWCTTISLNSTVPAEMKKPKGEQTFRHCVTRKLWSRTRTADTWWVDYSEKVLQCQGITELFTDNSRGSDGKNTYTIAEYVFWQEYVFFFFESFIHGLLSVDSVQLYSDNKSYRKLLVSL